MLVGEARGMAPAAADDEVELDVDECLTRVGALGWLMLYVWL